MKGFCNGLFTAVVGCALTLQFPLAADAQVKETVFHEFGGDADGEYPNAAMTDVRDTLYGTTEGGGAYRGGTVFSIAPGGTETVLHSFGNGADGRSPHGSLINVRGTFYGTTLDGGALRLSRSHGDGTVFSITVAGTETVLYSFCGTSGCLDGAGPNTSLINVKGILYGTTEGGGAYDGGTVFSITPDGAEKVLHSFHPNGSDGVFPVASVINVKGTLYGTTEGGGADDVGTVFSISPDGTEKVLHSFGRNSSDGVYPTASLINDKGKLYGTTEGGGTNDSGTIFSITPGGTEKVLYSFGTNSKNDGANPQANLIEDKTGKLYGTTLAGGNSSYGTVFSVTPTGTETVLLSFCTLTGYSGGIIPHASLINVKDTLYGTTAHGGAHNAGVVFSITP